MVVTSKVVSKVEGRLVPAPADPAGREAARQAAVDGETVRVVAARGRTRIVETRHGLVLAAAGVDACNVRPGELALLPVDPDASARRAARPGCARSLGVDVAVVVSDTMGRPWRNGVVDVAIGAAGIRAVDDLRGATDAHGTLLEITEVAVADEVAAAAELVKGKLVRGAGRRRPRTVACGRPGAAPGRCCGRRTRTCSGSAPPRRWSWAAAQALAGAADPPPAHLDAVAVLRRTTTRSRTSARWPRALLAFLDARPDATSRSCRAGHLTASAVVLDAAGERTLLTLHRAGRHLAAARRAPGGAGHHPARRRGPGGGRGERDRRPADRPGPGAPRRAPDHLLAGRAHPAHGRGLLAVAPAGAVEVRSDESDDLRWFAVDALPAGVTPPDVPVVVGRARARLAAARPA